MANAESFIAGGGSAHWDMLVYKHNQHQVDECEELARRMGFRWFRAKVSKRPPIAGLESPINWQQPVTQPGKIKCHAMAEKSEYIDARGRRIPCCWLGTSVVDPVTDIETVKATWKTPTPNLICSTNCSINKNRTTFENQWQRETQLC